MRDSILLGMDRRDFFRLVGCGAATVALSALASSPIALAADGGGGGGNESGGGTGTGGIWGNGYAWQWFDEGGFFDHPTDKAKQGWDRASATWFWDNKVMAYMRSLTGVSDLGLQDGQSSSDAIRGQDAKDRYYAAAEQALSAARVRSGEAHARVVGVGWCYCVPENLNGWFVAAPANWDRRFTDLIRKTAKSDGDGYHQANGNANTAPSGDGEGTAGDVSSDAGDGLSIDSGSGADEQLEGPELRAQGITKGDSGKRSFGDTDLSWHVVVDGGLPCIDVDGDWLVSDSGSKFKATLAFVLDDGFVLCEVRPFSLSDFEGGAVQGSLRLEFDGLSGHGVSAEDAMCDIVRDTGGSVEDDVEYLSHVFGW